MLEVRQKAEHGGAGTRAKHTRRGRLSLSLSLSEDKDYASFADVESAFASKELHPSAFKPAVQEIAYPLSFCADSVGVGGPAQDRAKAALAPLMLLPKDAAFKCFGSLLVPMFQHLTILRQEVCASGSCAPSWTLSSRLRARRPRSERASASKKQEERCLL